MVVLQYESFPRLPTLFERVLFVFNRNVVLDIDDAWEVLRKAANIRTLSISSLIGEAIGRTASEESVSSLFD